MTTTSRMSVLERLCREHVAWEPNADVPGHVDEYRALAADSARILRQPASGLFASDPIEGWADWMRARYLL